MTIKELSQIYYLKKEIAGYKEKIARLEARATDTSAKITGMPHTSGTSDKVGELSADAADYRAMLRDALERRSIELAKLNQYIEQCDDSLTRQILRYRFVECMNWRDVVDAIGGTSEYAVKHIVYRYINKNL